MGNIPGSAEHALSSGNCMMRVLASRQEPRSGVAIPGRETWQALDVVEHEALSHVLLVSAIFEDNTVDSDFGSCRGPLGWSCLVDQGESPLQANGRLY